MEFAARMIMSLLIISACILRGVGEASNDNNYCEGVGEASNDNNYCESDITNLHAPCLLQQQTLGVTLNTDHVSRTAKILMPTDLANSLPPKNFTLKSLDLSVSIGGKITTDYFTVKVAKRWNVGLSFSTLPDELKHITLVQLTYTVVKFTGVDEFLSTIHIHVGDTIYKMPFCLFHLQDAMSSESSPTTSAMPSESVSSSASTKSKSVSSSTASTTPSESMSSSTTPDTSSESESKPYRIPFILSIIFIGVQSLIIIVMGIWICYPHQVESRWRNCLTRRIASAIPQYTGIPQRNPSSPGEIRTDMHEMEVRVPMADTNQDSGNLHEQDETQQIPTIEGSPCIGQANGETCVVDVHVHQTERVDPTEQHQPTAESNLHVHAPTETCTGTLSALGDEKTEPGEEDIENQHTVGLGIPETQEIQAQEILIQREDTDQESDSDD